MDLTPPGVRPPVPLPTPTVRSTRTQGVTVESAGPHGHGPDQQGIADQPATDDQQGIADPLRLVLTRDRRYNLWVYNVGLACCAVEFVAGTMGGHDLAGLGVVPFAPTARQADLLVVSGTVTDRMAPAIARLYARMPDPKYVISFGSCANCGGPYWDSYCVTKGVDQIVPVDVYVPGCPPRPEALLQGILTLQERIAQAEPNTSPARPRPPVEALRRPLVHRPGPPDGGGEA